MLVAVRVGKRGVEGVIEDLNITRERLASMNDIPRGAVKEGMLLVAEIVDDIEHIVMPFESVESIAQRYGVRADYIREYNGIDRVFVGDRVYIEHKRET